MTLEIQSFDMFDMPASEYHSSKAVGHSSLVRMMRSPEHYIHYRNTPHISTPALEFGSAFHTAILEPELFSETYTTAPKFDRRTTVGKDAALAWEADNIGKLTLSQDQFDTIGNMNLAIGRHSTATRYLRQCSVEKSFFWTDAQTGIECKFRPDVLMLNAKGAVVRNMSDLESVVAMLDLKSTLDAGKDSFAKSMANYGYDMQAAYYSDPLSIYLGRRIPFYFLAVESAEPHGVGLYRTGERTLAIGRSKYRAALDLMSWCQDNKSWPGYQPYGEEEEIDVPRWERAVDMDQDDEGG